MEEISRKSPDETPPGYLNDTIRYDTIRYGITWVTISDPRCAIIPLIWPPYINTQFVPDYVLVCSG